MRKTGNPRLEGGWDQALESARKSRSGICGINSGETLAGTLSVVPIKLHTARAFIAWTRHALPPQPQAIFAIGVNAADSVMIGVAIGALPAVPRLDDGHTIELVHLAIDNTAEAGPALVGAAWRITLALGYHRLIVTTDEHTDSAGRER